MRQAGHRRSYNVSLGAQLAYVYLSKLIGKGGFSFPINNTSSYFFCINLVITLISTIVLDSIKASYANRMCTLYA